MKSNKNESQNSNTLNKGANLSKKFTPALLFSGIFVAISFIIQLIPLAVFNVSQIAAILGKRSAFLLMLAVATALIVLGSALSTLLVANGIMLLFAVPFFLSAILVREKKKHWIYATIVMFIPVFLFFYSIIFVADKNKYNEMLNNGFVALNATAEKTSQLNNNISNNNLLDTPAAKPTKDQLTVNPLASIESTKQLLEKFEQENPKGFKVFNEFLNYNPWQRILFFVFGTGSIVLFIALLISFANVVFVDFGFEQIERLRAIVNYVRKNTNSFASQLVNNLFSLPMVNTKKVETPILISQHRGLNREQNEKNIGFLSLVWKPLKTKNTIYWQGYAFAFQGQSPWNLREFVLPLPIVLGAISSLAAMGLWFNNFETMLKKLEHAPYASILALISLISFILLTIVALQGMFTLYKRLTTIVSLLLIVVVMSLLGQNLIGAFELLGFFGIVGLLDYVYDWRGIKIKQT